MLFKTVTVAISMQHISVHAPFLITRGTQISEEFEIFTDTYSFSNSFCMYFFLTPQHYFLLFSTLFQSEVYLKSLRAKLNLILLQTLLLHTTKFKKQQVFEKSW